MTGLLLAAMLDTMDAPVEFIDSKDDSTKAYIVFDTGCRILVDKADLKNEDRVITKAWEKCESGY